MPVTDALERAGIFVRTLSGWRQLLFVFVAGALSALSFAPFTFFPALLLGFTVLLLSLDGIQGHSRPLLHAALIGWCFGFGQFAAGMYWVGYAFFVEPSE